MTGKNAILASVSLPVALVSTMHRVPLPRTTGTMCGLPFGFHSKPTEIQCFLPVRLKSVRLTLLTWAGNARAESFQIKKLISSFFCMTNSIWGHTKELVNLLEFCWERGRIYYTVFIKVHENKGAADRSCQIHSSRL